MLKRTKTLLKCFSITICLCIALYFCLTSSFVLKLILEPVLSNLFGFPVSVEEIHYSPFTSIMKLKNVKMGYPDSPFVEGEKGSCKINTLLGLLGGEINFSDINLDSPTFRAVRFENGKWNLPWTNWPEDEDGDEESTDPLVHLNFPNVNIKNGKVIFEIRRKDPKQSSKIMFYNLKIKSPLFANNHQAKIDYKGLIKISSGKTVQVKTGVIAGSISSYFDEWTIPTSLISSYHVTDIDGKINNLGIRNNSVDLTTDIYTEGKMLKIRDLTFKEKHGHKLATDITVSGYLNSIDCKGNLKIKASPVSNEILNLFSGVFGNYNFGKMKLYYDGNIEFSNDSLLNKGKLVVNDFQINKNRDDSNAYKMPYDIYLDYKLGYKYTNKVLCLYGLSSFFSKNLVDQKDRFDFKHAEKALILSINDPVYFKFKNSRPDLIGNKTKGKIKLINLDIRFLNSFLVDLPKVDLFSGKSNGVFDFEIDPEHDDLIFKGKFNTDNISFRIGNYKHKKVRIVQDFECTLKDFRNLRLNPFSANLTTGKERILNAVINGNIDLVDHAVNLKISVPLLKDNILKYFPELIKNNSIFKGIIAQLKPFHISASSSINLNLKKRTGSIGNVKLAFNTGKYKNATLQLKNYIPFTWDSQNFELRKNISTNFHIEDLNLNLFNIFIPINSPFHFAEGVVNTSINCFFERHFTNVAVDGKVNMPSFSVRSGSNTINNLDINAIYKFNIDTLKKTLVFKNTNIILDTNRKNALSLESYGSYDFAKSELFFNGNIFNLNKNILSFFPNIYISKINKLSSSGKINIHASNREKSLYSYLKFDKMSYKSSDGGENIIPFDLGTMVLKISNNGKKTDIDRILFNLKKNNEIIFNLALDGQIPTPLSSGKSILNITSNKSYPGLIQGLNEAFSKNEEITKPKANDFKPEELPKEKRKSLDGVDFTGNIKFDNIILTHNTKARINAIAALKDNKLRIAPINGYVNDSPFKSSLIMDLQYSKIYPYAFNIDCDNILVSDLLNVMDIEDSKIKGNVSDLKMKISGIDRPFSKSKYKRLKGFLKVDAEDVTLPVNLAKYGIFKVMFIPLELLSRIRQMIPAGLTSTSIKNTLTSTSKIFTTMRQVHFQKAKVYVLSENDIQFKTVEFTGSPDDLIKLMKFSGSIYLNKNINIDAYSDISGLQFPLEIYGTIDDPETNTQKFLYDFMKDNTLNILNPQNIVDIFSDFGKGIQKTFNSGVNFISTPAAAD
jgi:hypothetical protein